MSDKKTTEIKTNKAEEKFCPKCKFSKVVSVRTRCPECNVLLLSKEEKLFQLKHMPIDETGKFDGLKEKYETKMVKE